MTTLREPELATSVDPMLPMPFRIADHIQETSDTFTLELVPAGVSRMREFTPGQFNMLYVFGIGDAAISLCGDPARPESLFHTVRVVGAVTEAMSKLEPGATIGVRGPFGNGWPMEEADGKDVLLIAGGIGLAPLRGALHRLLEHRERYGIIALLYGARTPHDIIYSIELEHLQHSCEVIPSVTVDHPTPDWRGKVGVVTKLIAPIPFEASNTIAMICGPEAMMRRSARALQLRNIPDNRIYLSMERNMECAAGLCVHCQLGPEFICRDGPIFRYDRIQSWLNIPEL
jgi:NAD(P)H-flavin reductase